MEARECPWPVAGNTEVIGGHPGQCRVCGVAGEGVGGSDEECRW